MRNNQTFHNFFCVCSKKKLYKTTTTLNHLSFRIGFINSTTLFVISVIEKESSLFFNKTRRIVGSLQMRFLGGKTSPLSCCLKAFHTRENRLFNYHTITSFNKWIYANLSAKSPTVSKIEASKVAAKYLSPPHTISC